MNRILVILAVIGCLIGHYGCAGWQNQTQDVIGRANSTAQYFWDLALPIVNERCEAAAMGCVEAGIRVPEECLPWVGCAEARRALSTALQALHMALYEAEVALSLGQEEKASAMAARALESIGDIYQMLKAMEVL